MTTAFLAEPPINTTFFLPGTNTPGTGVQLFTYVAGSVDTKTTVYQDNGASVAWSNPIILDSGGNLPSGTKQVFIPSGVAIKAVYAPSNDTDPPVSPLLTLPYISGINDVSSSVSEWVQGPAPTFVSPTSFTLVGDQTLLFSKRRRIKATVTAGTVYATVISATFGALTTVVVSGGALDSGLSDVFYGITDPTNPSIDAGEIDRQSTTTVPAGTTTNIWGTDGNSVHVTGTTAIASFGVAPYAGASKKVIFDSAPSIVYNASTMVIPNISSGSMTITASSVITIYADTTSKMLLYDATTQKGSVTLGATGSSGGPLTFSLSTATFRRNGGTVDVWGTIAVSGGVAVGGPVSITGLPYAATTSGPATFPISIGLYGNVSTAVNNTQLMAYVPSGSTTIVLYQSGPNPPQGGSALQGSGFGSGAAVSFGGSYPID